MIATDTVLSKGATCSVYYSLQALGSRWYYFDEIFESFVAPLGALVQAKTTVCASGCLCCRNIEEAVE